VSEQNAKHSDLAEIAKRNGEFRKNYGLIIGAFLYLYSVNATRARSIWWGGLFAAMVTGAVALIENSAGRRFCPQSGEFITNYRLDGPLISEADVADRIL
jgi:hypothetical protein